MILIEYALTKSNLITMGIITLSKLPEAAFRRIRLFPIPAVTGRVARRRGGRKRGFPDRLKLTHPVCCVMYRRESHYMWCVAQKTAGDGVRIRFHLFRISAEKERTVYRFYISICQASA